MYTNLFFIPNIKNIFHNYYNKFNFKDNHLNYKRYLNIIEA